MSSKSPLNTTKSASKPNFILKNKKCVKGSNTSQEEIKKNNKHKKYKRNLSKKSIGSINKNSSYSTSKIKGSFVQKPNEVSSVIKYNSFINSCKISPARTKSTERIPKKSHRKLDMNVKKVERLERK